MTGDWGRGRCTVLWRPVRRRPGVREGVEGVAAQNRLSVEVGEPGFCTGVPGSATRNGFAASLRTGVGRGPLAASSILRVLACGDASGTT